MRTDPKLKRWLGWWLHRRHSKRSRGPYLVLTNATDRIGVYVRGTGTLTVDWDDCTTGTYTLTGSNQAITKVYAGAANRTVTLIGDMTLISADTSAPLGGAGSWSCAGDMSKLPNLNYINVRGVCTLSGPVQEWPNLSFLYLQGNNVMSGNVQPWPLITYLALWGANQISGSVMPWPNVTNMFLVGNNRIGGEVQTWNNIQQLVLMGNNTVGGTVKAWPAITQLLLDGANTVSGDISGLTTLQYLSENATCNITHPGNWIGFTGLCYVQVKNLSTQAAVDNLLVSMDTNKGQTKVRAERTIICTAGCAAPSSTGLAAKASLAGAGWTVTTN